MFGLVSGTAPRGVAAGLTIITHGQFGSVSGWVTGMATSIPSYYRFPGTNVILYELKLNNSGGYTVTPTKIQGGHLTNDSTAEWVAVLDWSVTAGSIFSDSTEVIAAAVVPRLLQTNFIAELNGRALAELPIHLIGHSRGGSLVCEMGKLLGAQGVWVDQVTTLDPHPVNIDGNSDPVLTVDAPVRIYETVLFADNFYQSGVYPAGQLMPSSYNRRLTAFSGGYSSEHSDTHLWYHGTLDSRDPAYDGEASLSAADRAAWYTAYELSGVRAGYRYSRLSNGSRFNTNQPAGADRIIDGYNQRWDLGAGAVNNRTSLSTNAGTWPSLIQCHLAGTNLVAFGQTNSVSLSFQWARPATSNATLALYLDSDANPYTGNERLLRQWTVPGTGPYQVAGGAMLFEISSSNAIPGTHRLCAKITAGGRSRYLYAPEFLTILSSFDPPQLALARPSGGQVRVDVNGVAGQRVVLQASADLQRWLPVATNWLASARWSLLDNLTAGGGRFYRATVE